MNDTISGTRLEGNGVTVMGGRWDTLVSIDGIGTTNLTIGTGTALPGESGADAIWREVTACVADKGWATHGVYQQSGHLDQVFRQITRGEAA